MFFSRALARHQSRKMYRRINEIASRGQRDELIVMMQRAEAN